MATHNQVNLSLSGQSGTGSFAGTTSPVLTTPSVITKINDTNLNTILGITATASAVNYINVTNSGTGVPPELGSAGTDSNISMTMRTKGTGSFALVSAALTQPFALYNGTSSQHATVFSFANTSATRTVTFQDADGTLAYSADVKMDLIGSYTPSSTASVTQTNLSSTYFYYVIVIDNLIPATNNVDLRLRTSTNNGSSYDSGATDYSNNLWAVNTGGVTGADGANTSYMKIAASVGNTATDSGIRSVLELLNPSNSSERKCVHFRSYSILNNNSDVQFRVGACSRLSTTAVNAIELSFSSGNIASGNVRIYGVKSA